MKIRLATALLLCSTFLVAQEMRLEKLDASINSPDYDEISPVITQDGATLFFTRVAYPDFERTLLINGQNMDYGTAENYRQMLVEVYSQMAGYAVEDPYTSQFNQDVWIARGSDGLFTTIEHPGPPLNNALPNSVCSPTPGINEYVVINQTDRLGNMKSGFSTVRQLPNGNFSPPQSIRIDNYFTVSPGVGMTMSADGEVIIMSLQREGGFGATDLYVSFKKGDNHYGTPINLGPGVNTRWRESTPTLSSDKRTLYFSSNRPGDGGNDIYFVKRMGEEWQHWSQVKRLPAPINSAADDSQPYFNAATGFLYFSSKRDGSSDIFRIQVQRPRSFEDMRVVGKIIDSSTGALIGATVHGNEAGRKNVKRVIESKDGRFRMRVPQDVAYELTAHRPGYITRRKELRLYAKDNRLEEELVLYLDPLVPNAKIELSPIYFVQSKATIKPESGTALRELLTILRENPNLKIEIGGHTDNQGRKNDLQKLSQQRAEAIREYLLRYDIAPGRITARGYGDARPTNDNSTDALRAANRRVEVIITSVR